MATHLTALVSALGGPAIQPSEIEWALDLPAGKKLLGWLAAQLQDTEGGPVECYAALHDIALEHGEVDILNRALKLDANGSSVPEAMSDTLTGHLPLSRSDKQAEFMANETRLLQQETELLKSRLRQIKLASRDMSQTIKSLESAIQQEDEELGRLQDRLGDLSIDVDNAVSSSVNGANSLLRTLGCHTKPNPEVTNPKPQSESQDQDNIVLSTASLSQLSLLRSSIVDLHGSFQDKINQAARQLPKSGDIEMEAMHMYAVIGQQPSELAREAAFRKQLREICARLDSDDEQSGILKDNGSLDETPCGPSIQDELERAWAADEAEILEMRDKLLDMTISSFRDDLMKPLTALHDFLSADYQHIRETEALLGAVGEELEQVVDDTASAKENSGLGFPKDARGCAEDDLEAKLMELLKCSKDLRPNDGPPLVLLQKNDILSELRTLAGRAEDLQRHEEAQIMNLPTALSTLTSAHAPFLSQVYEHSLVNTSPPFSLSPDVARLHNEATRKGDGLGDEVGRLQKQIETVLESSRTKRKLGAFIDKWHKAVP